MRPTLHRFGERRTPAEQVRWLEMRAQQAERMAKIAMQHGKVALAFKMIAVRNSLRVQAAADRLAQAN